MKLGAHEDFSRKQEIRGPTDRNFGVVFTLFLAGLGVWPLWRSGSLRVWALLLSALLLAVTLVRPAVLHPLNRLWTNFGLLLGRLVSPVVIALLFYLVVTPIGFLMRRLGKDPLRMRPDPALPSYWIERNPPGPAPESMRNQF